MITLFLMNIIVGISSFLVTSRILNFKNFIDSILSLFILYFAQIVFSELLLGILGLLYLENLILVNLAILLIIWLIVKYKTHSYTFVGIGEIIEESKANKTILLAISVILGFGLAKACVNLVNPPFGWDSLNYHFTFPVEWLKHGNLDNPITIADDPSPSYYPINGSLYFLWLAIPLKNVFLADLGQLPFFILAFLAVFNIARKLKVSRVLSFYAAALFLIIPNFFKQLQIAYVDVMVAALFLVCQNFLFLLSREFTFKNTFIYSLSLGLLLGTKTVALPYSVLLFIPFVYLWLRNFRKTKLFVFSIIVIAIWGGFSYIRNFVDTGNPLYPLDFQVFGKAIFKGVMDKSIYSAHFRIEDYALTKLLFHEGLGVQTLLFILPAVLLALPIALIKKRKALNFNLVYFLVLPLFLYLVYRYVIPLANVRYLYPLLGIGIVSGFYTLETLRVPRLLIGISVAICTLVSMSELAKRQELISSIVITFLLLLILIFLLKYIKFKQVIIKPLFVILFLVLLIFSLALIEKNYLKNEYKRYIKMVKYSGFWPEAAKAWDWLNQNTYGNNIAYAGRPVVFPLYGTSFKNNVYYVSVNKIEPAKLHYFKDSRYTWGYDFLSLHKNLEAEGNYRSGAEYSTWLSNLIKRNTEYLFIYSLHQTKEVLFPIEDVWAKENPKEFIPVFNNNIIHVYKIAR
ncbi:MAG: hypothetical protein PHQ57_00265 [Candidatus Omnitrophica bacterium]|nr:hypothetical protein [Candidatus Omnitrophota bacterium]